MKKRKIGSGLIALVVIFVAVVANHVWFRMHILTREEPTTYLDETYDTLMLDGVLYTRFETPFSVAAIESSDYEGHIDFVYSLPIDEIVYFYDVAKNYPVGSFLPEEHSVYEATLPNGAAVKQVYYGTGAYLYCLPEEKDAVLNFFNNVSWENKTAEIGFAHTPTEALWEQERIPLSREFSTWIYDTYARFLSDCEDGAEIILPFPEEYQASDAPYEFRFAVYFLDDSLTLAKHGAEITRYTVQGKHLFLPCQVTLSSNVNKVNSSWEDFNYLFTPEAFDDEIVRFIAPFMGIEVETVGFGESGGPYIPDNTRK